MVVPLQKAIHSIQFDVISQYFTFETIALVMSCTRILPWFYLIPESIMPCHKIVVEFYQAAHTLRRLEKKTSCNAS